MCLATKFPYQQEIVPLNLQDDPSLYVWLAPSFLRPHLGLTNGQWGAGKTSKYNCKVNCRCNSFSPFKASEADQDPLVGLKCTTFVPILCKTNFCGFEIEVGKYFSRFITHVVMQKMSHIFPIFRLLGNALFYIKIPFCFCSLSLKKVKARTKQFWRGSLVDHFCTSLLKRYVLPSAMYWIFRWKGRFFTRNNLWS